MPQTPNNAPTYKQQLLFTVHGQRVSQSAIQTLGFYLLSCVFHPDNFQINKKVSSMTLAHSTNQGCNCTHKIKLLRKEVIHPHLPVRVPCYDFVPIADPTFDGSLTSLGHRLRVLPTFMT